MNIKLITFAFFSCLSTIALSQSIYIGDDAQKVRSLVQYEVQTFYQAQGYHQVEMSWDTKYHDGQISEVILCKENVPMIDLRKAVDFCVHYVIQNGNLSKIITQYKNISLKELQTALSKLNTTIGNYFFDNDFEHYSRIYLSSNGLATKEYTQTVIKELPLNIKDQIQSLRQDFRKTTEVDENVKKKKEIEKQQFKSHPLNLQIIRPLIYEKLVNDLQDNLAKFFDSKYFIKNSELLKTENGFKYVIGEYNLKVFTEDHSRAAVVYRNYIEAGSHDVKTKNEITVVSGFETKNIAEKISLYLPTIDSNNIECMTVAYFNNVKFTYTKGLSILQVAKKQNISIVKYQLNPDIQTIIFDAMKDQKKGKYIILYGIGTINEKEIKKIEIKPFNNETLRDIGFDY